ncbi:hypothetical protein H0H92_010739, partial [Tricholoma furcatifolium]
KENLEKAQSKILKLKKQVQKLKSKNVAEDDDDVEEPSEGPERDDKEIGFSSSIQPLQAIEEQEQTTLLQVRRIKLAELNCSTARRHTSQPESTHHKPQNQDSGNEDDSDNQKITKNFNERVQTAAAADNSDSGTNDKPTGLLTPRLVPDVKESAPPTITDYASPVVRSLLLAAVRKYEGHIIGRNAFPSLAVQVSWATTVWKEAQDE